jgi:hypothetical protein
MYETESKVLDTIDDSLEEDEDLDLDPELNPNKKETWYFRQIVEPNSYGQEVVVVPIIADWISNISMLYLR